MIIPIRAPADPSAEESRRWFLLELQGSLQVDGPEQSLAERFLGNLEDLDVQYSANEI
jgi:hypothetical protein